jgi:hypothetical protein
VTGVPMYGSLLGRSSSLEPVHQISTPPYSVRYLDAARALFQPWKNGGKEDLHVQTASACANRRTLDVDLGISSAMAVCIVQGKRIKGAVSWRQDKVEGLVVSWNASLD